jgi:hypothetical protein
VQIDPGTKNAQKKSFPPAEVFETKSITSAAPKTTPKSESIASRKLFRLRLVVEENQSSNAGADTFLTDAN